MTLLSIHYFPTFILSVANNKPSKIQNSAEMHKEFWFPVTVFTWVHDLYFGNITDLIHLIVCGKFMPLYYWKFSRLILFYKKFIDACFLASYHNFMYMTWHIVGLDKYLEKELKNKYLQFRRLLPNFNIYIYIYIWCY